MLNNIQMNEDTLKVLGWLTGHTNEEDLMEYYEITDTRDTVDDFAKGASEFSGVWRDYQGVYYFDGRIQQFKGDRRRDIYIVPQGDWNVICIGG
jgi:hypothetical protein